jgi:branched-subunit amino acid aminotransferase/4-amino-4-deoxychorismate lyase
LAGVTRLVVLEICQKLGLASREMGITPSRLFETQGVFMSLSSRGIVELVMLDGRRLNRSPLVKKIRSAYAEMIEAA